MAQEESIVIAACRGDFVLTKYCFFDLCVLIWAGSQPTNGPVVSRLSDITLYLGFTSHLIAHVVLSSAFSWLLFTFVLFAVGYIPTSWFRYHKIRRVHKFLTSSPFPRGFVAAALFSVTYFGANFLWSLFFSLIAGQLLATLEGWALNNTPTFYKDDPSIVQDAEALDDRIDECRRQLKENQITEDELCVIVENIGKEAKEIGERHRMVMQASRPYIKSLKRELRRGKRKRSMLRQASFGLVVLVPIIAGGARSEYVKDMATVQVSILSQDDTEPFQASIIGQTSSHILVWDPNRKFSAAYPSIAVTVLNYTDE